MENVVKGIYKLNTSNENIIASLIDARNKYLEFAISHSIHIINREIEECSSDILRFYLEEYRFDKSKIIEVINGNYDDSNKYELLNKILYKEIELQRNSSIELKDLYFKKYIRDFLVSIILFKDEKQDEYYVQLVGSDVAKDKLKGYLKLSTNLTFDDNKYFKNSFQECIKYNKKHLFSGDIYCPTLTKGLVINILNEGIILSE